MKTRRTFITAILLLTCCFGYLAGQTAATPGSGEQRKVIAAKTQIGMFDFALRNFYVDNDRYPASGDLNALIHKPAYTFSGYNALGGGWRGPYLDLKRIPLDPWGHPYIYQCPGKHNPKSFDLSSMGPDGKAGTADDITNWK